jgi:hypothetical protein
MTIILGLSGKKKSGKNTCFNWLLGNHMLGLGLVEYIKMNEFGQLVVPAEIDGQIQDGVFDPDNPEAANFLNENVWPFIKQYSFATSLKQFCMTVFSLTCEQCYGSNDQKNSYTQLQWENMPVPRSIAEDSDGTFKQFVNNKFGLMTAREVLQYFGTEICRQILDNCWVNALIRTIQQEQSQFAVITDVRFPNEVEGIQKAVGKVIRFTRAPVSDEHESEKALDGYTGFDAVIDNADMNIPEQNDAVTKLLIEWGYAKQYVAGKIPLSDYTIRN